MLYVVLFLGAFAFSGDQMGPNPALSAAPIESQMPVSLKADSLADDRTFLRRIWLDMVGRPPERDRVQAFVNDEDPAKRSREIDFLLNSEMFTDRWTIFFTDLFQIFPLVDREYPVYRNAIHQNLRNMIASNMPWDEMARSLITGTGKGEAPETAMFLWAKESIEESFRLDYLDDQAAWITDTMLGVQTLCISCHDGVGHLEKVNLGLTAKSREDFWGLASFLASTYLYAGDIDFDAEAEDEEEQILNILRNLRVIDLDQPDGFIRRPFLLATLEGDELGVNGENMFDGSYHAESMVGQGMRPPRSGGVIQPKYPFTGEAPQPGESRRAALARMLTSDRQFARNMVNRIWAHFFGEGFVEPHNGWDLARVDEASALANASTVQPRNAPLMEFLTDWFIDNGYDLRGLIRLLTHSKLYQWDYAAIELGAGAIGEGDPWAFWRDNRRVRRVEAETVVESLNQVLGLKPKYVVAGALEKARTSAWQLPDPSEPSDAALYSLLVNERDEIDFNRDISYLGVQSIEELFYYTEQAQTLLESFGRGNYIAGTPRNRDNTIQNGLMLFNSFLVNFWLEQINFAPNVLALADALDQGAITKTEVVERLYLDVLFRPPSGEEMDVILDHIQNLPSRQAVADSLWMVLNHPDFLYK